MNGPPFGIFPFHSIPCRKPEHASTQSFFAQVHSAEEKEEGGNLLWLSGLAEPFDVFLGFAGDSRECAN